MPCVVESLGNRFEEALFQVARKTAPMFPPRKELLIEKSPWYGEGRPT